MKLALTVVALALVAGVLMGACGGGGSDSLTLEQYFAELETIRDDLEAQLAEAYEAYPDEEAALMEDETNLPLLNELAAAFPRALSGLLDSLESLDPPKEAEEAHNEMIAATEEVVAQFDDAVEQLEGAQTMAEFEALDSQIDAELGPGFTRFDDACFDLALLAAENDIEIDLQCGE